MENLSSISNHKFHRFFPRCQLRIFKILSEIALSYSSKKFHYFSQSYNLEWNRVLSLWKPQIAEPSSQLLDLIHFWQRNLSYPSQFHKRSNELPILSYNSQENPQKFHASSRPGRRLGVDLTFSHLPEPSRLTNPKLFSTVNRESFAIDFFPLEAMIKNRLSRRSLRTPWYSILFCRF